MKKATTNCSTATVNIAGLVLAKVSAPARQHARYA
jgi:hypothetical protein